MKSGRSVVDVGGFFLWDVMSASLDFGFDFSDFVCLRGQLI